MKKIFVFLFAIALIFSFTNIATAHPGGTDGSGGHLNHSTGIYHYHHGFPEHGHRDMDGDGTKDCPYNFKDKTGWNSGSSTSHDSTESTSHDNTDKDYALSPLIVCGVLILSPIGWSLPFLYMKIYDFFDKRKRKEKPQSKELLSFWHEQERGHFSDIYGGKDIIDLVKAPYGTIVNDAGLPAKTHEHTGFDPYTVYVTGDGACYHHKKGCCGAYWQKNIAEVPNLRRCKRCGVPVDLSWYEEYLRISKIKAHYGIDL